MVAVIRLCILAVQLCNHLVLQASKADEDQPLVADTLSLFSTSRTADVSVIGCGPAGLALAAQLAKQGLAVCLIGGYCQTCKLSSAVASSSPQTGNMHDSQPDMQAMMRPLSTTTVFGWMNSGTLA